MLLGIWTIALAGILATCICGFIVINRPSTYWSRVQVLFIAPKSTVNPNGLLITPSSLIAAAGVVAKMVDDPASAARVVSEDVTLAGEGIKHGYSVTLPNSGGQWANNFTQAQLDVQVVGSSPTEVNGRMHDLLAQIDRSLATVQSRAKVSDVNLIRTRSSPAIAPLYRQDGSRVRAAGGTLVLGFGLTAAAMSLSIGNGRRPKAQMRVRSEQRISVSAGRSSIS